MLRLGGGEEGKLPAINIYCEIPIRVDTITLQTQQTTQSFQYIGN